MSGSEKGLPDFVLLAAFIREWDVGPDGISVPAFEPKLNGGFIWSDTRATADADLGDHAITNAEVHTVRGGG